MHKARMGPHPPTLSEMEMSKGLFDCTGKVTLVTGGNGGIGLGFASGVAKIGCDLAISARNAEGAPGFNWVFDMPTSEWHKFLDVALHGAFITLREAARHMVARAEAGEPGGSLVACGSLSLFHGLPGKQNYAASKSGVAAIVRCMAVEFGKHAIRANIVAPDSMLAELN